MINPKLLLNFIERENIMQFSIILRILFSILLTVFCNSIVYSEVVTFQNCWGDAGWNLVTQSSSGVEIIFSIEKLYFEEIIVDDDTMTIVSIPGIFIPSNVGAPDVPGDGRYIAIPQNATVSYQIDSSRIVNYSDINLAPTGEIVSPSDTSECIGSEHLGQIGVEI